MTRLFSEERVDKPSENSKANDANKPHIDLHTSQLKIRPVKGRRVDDSVSRERKGPLTRSSLKSRRDLNFQIPFLQMPEELLLQIIRIFVRDYPPCWDVRNAKGQIDWYRYTSGKLTNFLVITHICSLLRRICLRAPLLWNYIDLRWPPAAVEEFSKRAQKTPLSLELDIRDSPGSSSRDRFFVQGSTFCIRFLRQNLKRARDFELNACIDDLNYDFDDFWRHVRRVEAPNLEKFSLYVRPEAEDENDLANLFSRKAPKLRELTIDGACYHKFNPEGFQSLTSLTLLGCDFSSLGDVSRLPRILAQTPKLIELELHGDPSEYDAYVSPLAKPLAELRDCVSFEVGGFFADHTGYLFSAVSFPSLRKLQAWSLARIHNDCYDTSPFVSLPPALGAPFSTSRHLHFSLEESAVVIPSEVEFGDACDMELSETHDASSVANSIRSTESFMLSPMKILNIVPESLSISTYSEISDEVFTKDLWKSVLSECSRVTEITIEGKVPMTNLIAALMDPDLVCPSLDILDLQTEDSVEESEDFKAMLRYREERNAKIQTNIEEVDSRSDSDVETE
ncbi:hypothetical protein SISSUDRAFT_1037611 [Sistotremastrum suecicum HHB10207 ss-3]|uniref:F-box domain-containing protein n=1 Tax=Sistotremastrum suecicum HHB10207 ss-3 TaxID=1314776 RepID=A0A165XWM0_9AGAM|nr:hypothetical protein SISSUDRAFT_1037611 [Sistotremastrum suecicum HHB10207 ss-3]